MMDVVLDVPLRRTILNASVCDTRRVDSGRANGFWTMLRVL